MLEEKLYSFAAGREKQTGKKKLKKNPSLPNFMVLICHVLIFTYHLRANKELK